MTSLRLASGIVAIFGSDAGVERLEASLVGRGLGIVVGGVGGIGGLERRRDPVDVQLARTSTFIHRCGFCGAGLFAGQQRPRRAGRRRASTSGVPVAAAFVIVFSSQSSRPRPFITSELGAGHGLDVGRLRREGVDVAVLADEARHGDEVAADVLHHVGEDRRRRDDIERAAGRLSSPSRVHRRRWQAERAAPAAIRVRPSLIVGREGWRPRRSIGQSFLDRAAWHEAHRPKSSRRWDFDAIAAPAGDLLEDARHPAVAHVCRLAALGADDVVVMGRVAGDERVLAGGQVEPLDDAEVREDVERAEDRGAADPEALAPRRGHELLGREVAAALADQAGDAPPGLRDAVSRIVERGNDRVGSWHARDSITIETQSQ